MALAGLTSGIDNKVSFIDPVNGVLLFTYVESFMSEEDATIDKLVQMNGVVSHPKFHQGWRGSFVTQRNNPVLDRYFALQEAGYYQSVGQFPVTITQTITENTGVITQLQFTDGVLKLDDAGDYTGTSIVKQRVSFMAFRKNLLL
jgi:hypothetical protein